MSDTYASHLPILRSLSKHFNVRKVLELGAGHYSTPAFLDRNYFPDLYALHSYETDRGWYESLSTAFGKDKRLMLIHTTTPLHEILAQSYWAGYDVIFVDNGSKVSERVLVLETLNEVQPSSVVVVHDYNVREYQHSTRDFPLRIVHYVEPYTAILMSKSCPYYKDWILE